MVGSEPRVFSNGAEAPASINCYYYHCCCCCCGHTVLVPTAAAADAAAAVLAADSEAEGGRYSLPSPPSTD